MNRIVDLGVYAFIVGAILVLTRPNSQGPKLVSALGSSFSGVVRAATGQGPGGR
jgi:hypothetical protein